MVPVLSYFNSVHALPNEFLKTYSNIIPPYILGLPNGLILIIYDENNSPLSHACNMTHIVIRSSCCA
jgi:hypothetical protein